MCCVCAGACSHTGPHSYCWVHAQPPPVQMVWPVLTNPQPSPTEDLLKAHRKVVLQEVLNHLKEHAPGVGMNPYPFVDGYETAYVTVKEMLDES